tara:strand:- start:1222 stop:1518 length:297 start_codon:yes stop_codon:yes gene_type:complete
MNPINYLKKWLLNLLIPYIEGTSKKKDSLQQKRFRDLFKKRKSALIIGSIVLCLIVFGLDKSFSFITGIIVCSPIFVVFWNSFGEQLIGRLKFRNNKK